MSVKKLREEIKALQASIKNNILMLNNKLPQDITHFWVTCNELYDRLIIAGVSKLLKISHVELALQTANRGQKHLAKWKHAGISYYRSQAANYSDSNKVEVPIDQRFKAIISPRKGSGLATPKSTLKRARININPPRDFFKHDSVSEFEELNNNLQREHELMQQLPVETSEVAVQASPSVHSDFDDVELDASSSNYFMQGKNLEEFIRASTSHAAKCGMGLVLVERNDTCGCFMKQIWKCPCCNEELTLENCDMVRSLTIAQGANYSRTQPDFNLRVVKGAALVGINTKKLGEFLQGEMGIKIADYRNLRHQMTKVRQSIKETFEERKKENRKEHVQAVRATENYRGDVEWVDSEGNKHSTSAGPICHDGAGCTRVYNHRHRGRQSAFVVNSRVIGKPLALVVSQTNCIRCTMALNRRIRASKGVVTVDQIGQFSMEHKGVCYRNSTLNPASAEETQAAVAARDLLLNEDGEYHGDDFAVFALNCQSDNDTRASKAITSEQNKIMGSAADNVGEGHKPDKGHVMKDTSNSLFELRKKDKSFNSVNCLSNMRIKVITKDIKKVLDYYTEKGIGDLAAKNECLKQIDAIVTHQCGNHDLCVHERWCTFLKVKKLNPDWSDGQIRTQAFLESKRALRGKNMSLSGKGIAILTSHLRKRFNANTIDAAASGGCSNRSESFWNVNTKFSEGKRLNHDHTDAWVTTNQLTFCRIGNENIERTHDSVSGKLGLKLSVPEINYQEKAKKLRNRIKKRQATQKSKDSRSFSKMSKEFRTGQEDAKKAHRSGKVPWNEVSRSKASKQGDKSAKSTQRKCSNCKIEGHTITTCKLPHAKKRCAAELVSFDENELNMMSEHSIRSKKMKSAINLVSAGEWI